MPKKVEESVAQLKCVDTKACSMGYRQEEPKDTVAITETWWDKSHNWGAAWL